MTAPAEARRYEFEYTVQPGDAASRLALSPEDDYPEVLATSRMVALMELAAARMLRGELGPGQMSVGVGVDIRHLAATPIGDTVRAVAIDLGPEGKLRRFRVELHDSGGIAGEGLHTRAIVSTQRLMEGAARRRQASR